MMGVYGLFLVAAVAVGCAVFYPAARRAGLSGRTLPLLALLSVLLGALCSRLYLHAAKYMVNGAGFWGYTPLSSRPYEYAVCGTALGVMLAGCVTAKLTGQKALSVLDALAPAALLALAVARFGEHFSDFGWGQVLVSPLWQRFPFAVQDIFGQWHLAVYMLEGVLALMVGAWVLRARPGQAGESFLRALLWWAAAQILCESLRAETIRWGFVRVQQLQCAVFMLAVLLANAKRAGRLKRAGRPCLLFFAGIGVIVFVEYALDKLEFIPVPVLYGLMAAALVCMCLTAQGRCEPYKDGNGETV